ncbi:MAG: hypothetical protein HOB52_04195 [Euryarchaeota archaeon]|jgi:predicted CoA-binding protein|nr:hypothetical protein [Euryarchaeota archaeon]MBT6644982.1 hypothetical protein [Euryarchaeota archaeon]
MQTFKDLPQETAIEHCIEMKNIALIGISPLPESASFQDLKGMLERGYTIHLVNPKLSNRGIKILGLNVYSSMVEIEDVVEVVNLHIATEDVGKWISDLSERMERHGDIGAIWFEPNIDPAQYLEDAYDFGWMVITEVCILSEIKKADAGHNNVEIRP